MRTTERGLLANRSRLAQHMQANSRFVVSFSRCIYSMAKFILCLTACYCRDQASVTSHAHSCKLLFSSPFLRPVQSRVQVMYCPIRFASDAHRNQIATSFMWTRLYSWWTISPTWCWLKHPTLPRSSFTNGLIRSFWNTADCISSHSHWTSHTSCEVFYILNSVISASRTVCALLTNFQSPLISCWRVFFFFIIHMNNYDN